MKVILKEPLEVFSSRRNQEWTMVYIPARNLYFLKLPRSKRIVIVSASMGVSGGTSLGGQSKN